MIKRKMEARIGNVEHARDVYQRGIEARCGGMHNVWQGLGALEASMGNRDRAREVRWFSCLRFTCRFP